jgi:hypothetical protein
VYDSAISNLGVRYTVKGVYHEKNYFCTIENIGACSQVNQRHILTATHCFYFTGVHDPAISNLGVRNKGSVSREKTINLRTKENIGACSQLYFHRRPLLLLHMGV